MKNLSNHIYTFAYRAVQIISLLLTGLLFVSGFLFTCYSLDMESQVVLKRQDNLLVSVLGIAVSLLLSWFLTQVICHKPISRKRFLLAAVLLLQVILGIWLVLFGRTMPAADSASVYHIAESLANGDTSVIHPTDSYLSYYPHQIGLVAFYEGLIRLWKLLPIQEPAYHMIKCLNVLMACGMVCFTYHIVEKLFRNDRITTLCLLLAGGNLPLIFYTSFVYGEIPSLAFFTAGLYLLLLFLECAPLSGKPVQHLYGTLSVILFTASVLLRKNSLILIIGVALVLLFQWIQSKRHCLLVMAALTLVCALGILPATQSFYEHRAGSHLSSGVPAMTYFAMGMQEASRGNGWYNGFNFNTYQESGLDAVEASRTAREAVRERLEYFKENPSYTISFYWDKFLSQWADGTYACRQASLSAWGRSQFLTEIYEGKYSAYVIRYCNISQNILYLGAFLFCLLMIKKKAAVTIPGLPVYLCLIGVIGGFLFHMIWEANSRYIFPYGFLLLPYAAYGIHWLTEVLVKACMWKKNQKMEEP